jgi:hypothetical protein
MRVLSIVGQHIGVELGPFVERMLSERHFLYVEDGMHLFYLYLGTLLMLFSFSVLPALSLNDGILHCDVVEGSFCTESFCRFIEKVLDNMQPYPNPNSVLVMDNCRIHRHPMIEEMICAR